MERDWPGQEFKPAINSVDSIGVPTAYLQYAEGMQADPKEGH